MGIFSSIGGLFDKPGSRQLKKHVKEVGRTLYGSKDAPQGPFEMSTGTFSSPFATATYGPTGGGGSGYAKTGGAQWGLTEPFQNLLDRGIGQAGVTSGYLDKFITPDYFTGGPIFDLLNESRVGRVQRAEDAAANAMSNIFNLQGVNTASGMDMSKIINDLNAAKSQEDFNVLANQANFMGALQQARGTDFGYLQGFQDLGSDAMNRAAGLSGDLTNLELAKLSRFLDAEQNYSTMKAGEPGWGARIGGALDAGATIAAAGMTGAFQSVYDPNYAMNQFFEKYQMGRGGGGPDIASILGLGGNRFGAPDPSLAGGTVPSRITPQGPWSGWNTSTLNTGLLGR